MIKGLKVKAPRTVLCHILNLSFEAEAYRNFRYRRIKVFVELS